MFSAPPREKEWISWLYVTAWTLVIYVTIPFARIFQGFIRDRFGKELFTSIVLAAVVVCIGLMLLRVAAGTGTARSWPRLAWLLSVGVAYAGYTWRLRTNPEEALHFIEYGALGLLLFRALVHRVRDWTIYFSVTAAGAILGVLDEVIQWVTPERFWGWRDVWFNAVSCALMALAIARGIRPSTVSLDPGPASLRLLCRLLAALTVLCGLCLSNRVDRVERYARRIPGLAFLSNNPSVMAEYGHRHDDPGIGSFFSRMTIGELKENDARRGTQVAMILDEYHDPRKYGAFLNTYSPAVDAFAHEARVHLFRRDHYIAVLPKHRADPAMHRYHATVAFRENQIVEKYFSNTLARTRRYRLRPEKAEELRGLLDEDIRYVSPVSEHLITGFTEGQIWALLGVVLAALAVLDRAAPRRLVSRRAQ